MKGLIVALAVVAFLYFGFVDDSLLQFGHGAPVSHTVQKAEVPTFADEVWWMVFWWTPLVIMAGAGAGGCWWVLGKARKHWRLIEAENGVFPVAQVNTATWSQWWKGIKQISYVPVDMIGQEAATITIHPDGNTQVNGGRADWTSAHQLEMAKGTQRTRMTAAVSSGGMKYAAQAKFASGMYDKAPRVIDAPVHNDAPAIAMQPDRLLTAADALARSNGKWVIGQNQQTGAVALFDPKTSVHAAIVGVTGTGKTTSTGFLMILNALRERWHIIILDGKGGADWKKFAQYGEWQEATPETIQEQLERVLVEHERRKKMLADEGAANIDEYSGKIQHVMVMIEEYGSIVRTLNTWKRTRGDDPAIKRRRQFANNALERCDFIIGELVSQARSTGVHLVLIDQYPEHWTPQALSIKFRVVYQLGPNQGALLEEYEAGSLPDHGTFMMRRKQYDAWYVKPDLPALLADKRPSFSPPMLECMHLPSFQAVDVGGGKEVLPSPPVDTMKEGSEEGSEAQPTDLQKMVWAWRDAHPNGRQVEMIRAFAANGINITSGYASKVWARKDEGVTPASSQASANPSLSDLLAQHGEVYVHGQRVTMAVDKTQEFRPA